MRFERVILMANSAVDDEVASIESSAGLAIAFRSILLGIRIIVVSCRWCVRVGLVFWMARMENMTRSILAFLSDLRI